MDGGVQMETLYKRRILEKESSGRLALLLSP